MNNRVHVKIIGERVYIKMINLRRLKKICALTGVHLYHETSDIPKGYYISLKQIDKFIEVMNNSSYDVMFIGEERI